MAASLDEEVWAANTIDWPWNPIIFLPDVPTFFELVTSTPDCQTRRYIISDPAPLHVSASFCPGPKIALDDDRWFVNISSIVVRTPFHGTGTTFLQQLIQLCLAAGLGFKLSGGYNSKSHGLAAKVGLKRGGFYDEYYI